MKKFLLIICVACLLIGDCGSDKVKGAALVKNSITIQVNGKNFSAMLENNPSAKKFAEMLPLELRIVDKLF